VIVMITYGLRRGSGPAIPNRRLPPAERRAWTWSFLSSTLILFAGFAMIGRWLDPAPLRITAMMSDVGIASLRAPATAVIIFAVALQARLRAPRAAADHLSSGPER
jgi:hypothetical protein